MGARQRSAARVRLLAGLLIAALLAYLVMAPAATVGAAPARSARSHGEPVARRVARAEAERLLAALRLPESAKQVHRPLGEESGPRRSGTLALDAHWRSRQAPQALLAWLEGHPPHGARRSMYGIQGKGGTSSLSYAFAPPPRQLISARLTVSVIAVHGGGTAVAATVQVAWWPLRPPAEHIPKGISAITVYATAAAPEPISVSQTITDPRSIGQVTTLVESLRPIGEIRFHCPKSVPGALRLELQFRKAPQSEPLVTVTASRGACALVGFSAHGKKQPVLLTASGQADSSAGLIKLIESLTGVEL